MIRAFSSVLQRFGAWPAIAATVAVAGTASAVEVPRPVEERVSYHRQIRPLFEAQCHGCHQPAKAKGDYVMTRPDALLGPGKSGERAIIPGEPEASLLVRQITPVNGEADMPKGRPPLHEAEIALVRRWIREGALDDTPPNVSRGFDADHPPVYSRPPVITALDFSPDGSLLAVAGFHEVLLHRSDGSGLEARLIGLSERIQSVRFSPDGRSLAVAGGQPARLGEIQIWDVETRQLRHSVPVGHDTVFGVHWSPDGRLVSFGCPDKTVRALDATTGKPVLQQMAHEDWVLDTVFSTNGTHVISVGRDMTAKLTEVVTQRFVDNLTSITPGALRGGLMTVARHPKRDEVLVGGADGQPQVYQVFRQVPRKIGDNAALLRRFPAMEGRIFSVDYRPDGDAIAAAASLDGRGAIHLYAARFDPQIPEVLLKAYQKTSGEYTKEEREAIDRFTTADVKLLHRIDVPFASVYAVSFSPDGRRLAAGTSTGVVLGIDTETGRLELVFAAAPLANPVDVASPGGLANRPPGATAVAKDSGEEASPEFLPSPDRIAALKLEPAVIRVERPTEHVQLLATAILTSGDTVDVTRSVHFDVTDGLGTVDSRGQFSGTRAGHGRLRATLGGTMAEASVELGAFTDEIGADFVQDVNPVLSRLGCNAGTCHGAREGKNGFKLSLRGYDPIFDIRSLTDDMAARRINPASPDQSLMLLKATGAVPHEGGRRTPRDSEAYTILRAWIAAGAAFHPKSPRVARIELSPVDPVIQDVGGHQQMRVVATFADGRVRDVTAEAFIETGNADVAAVDSDGRVLSLRRGEAPILARYEGSYAATTLTVMGDREGFVWVDPPTNNRIDELVAAKWKRLKILPSDLCSDATFIRRVSLDLTGLPPTADEVRAFLANPRDGRSKRDALIERLLGSSAFVDHWANKWADLLQVNRKFLGQEGARLFQDWIRAQVASNTPYDAFVRSLLTASGSNRENAAASYWKILRTPAETLENTTHLFLATRFNCNKCHDHPFERWTQDQYYELAQYFAQVGFRKDDASGDRRIGGTAVEDSRPLFEIVSDLKEGGVPHDRTGQVVAPAFPYAAGSPTPAAHTSRRAELAAWLTSADNRYFALSYVNRLWGYLLGVGLVEPLDDIRAGNPPSNPALLEHLTREFVESGFNTRHILRQICQSRTYQLDLIPNRWNEDDRSNYSHALPRRLPAEVLFDAVHRVAGATPQIPGAEPGSRASQLLDAAIDVPGGFLANLGRPPRESACECERSGDLKLSSVLSLLSGPAISAAIADPTNDLARLAESEIDDGPLADELFLRVLNRPAAAPERRLLLAAVAELDQEHARLDRMLKEAENDWRQRQPRLELARTEAIARAEVALAGYLVERGPRQAAAERARLERIASAEAAVRDDEPRLENLLASWETALGPGDLGTAWIPLDPRTVEASGSAQLRKLPDGSVRSTASVGELPTYTVTAETPVAGITGIKLEALPDPELPRFGPGHADGDFVLAEFIVDAASKTNAGAFARVGLKGAAADHNADGLDVGQLFNGIGEQGRLEGWRIGRETGRPHWVTFAFNKTVGDTNGTVLRFSLQHRFEAPYEIGRFRLWITTSTNALVAGLPQGLAAIVRTPSRNRTEAQIEQLRSHLRAQDPEMLRHGFELTLARKPLPDDARLRELEQDLARAARPIPVDPTLLRLRQDFELSARQLARKRVTAVQDVAWALINTPAFLFNR